MGLNIYDKRTGAFRHIRHSPNQAGGITGNDVWVILEDKQGNFILSIAGIELNILSLDDDFFDHGIPPEVDRLRIPPQQNKHANELFNIRDLYKDADENIWVVGDQYMYRLDVSAMNLQQTAPTDSSFYRLYVQKNGSVWAFKRDGQLFNWNAKDTAKVANLGQGI